MKTKHRHRKKLKTKAKTKKKTLNLVVHWGFMHAVSASNWGLLIPWASNEGTTVNIVTDTTLEGAFTKLQAYIAEYNTLNYFPLAQYKDISAQAEGSASSWYTPSGRESYAHSRIWTCRRKTYSSQFPDTVVSDIEGYVGLYTFTKNPDSNEFVLY